MAYSCILCGTSASAETHSNADEHTVKCAVCGSYVIEGPASAAFKNFSWAPDLRYLLSAMTRTAPVRGLGTFRVTMNLLGRASRAELSEPNFKDKRAAMLDWIEYESRRNSFSPYGAPITLNKQSDYPVAWCHDTRAGNISEWTFLFKPLVDEGLVLDLGDNKVQITNKGWEYLESRPNATGGQCFIAMAFKDMDTVHDAIATAVKKAGYKPLRIDSHEYIGGIMDEILARIRESRFVVADLTHNRGGVYYEAGFALGLRIPVIPTCRHDHLDGDRANHIDRVHFDVQHLNLITWTPDKLSELTERLTNRIEAILGRGPL